MVPLLECYWDGPNTWPLNGEELLDPRREVSRTEQMMRFEHALLPLYWQAVRVQQRGISHRNFCVACAVWAFREDASSFASRWKWFFGVNSKVLSDSRNTCAEPVALTSAHTEFYSEVPGMLIVGETQADEDGIVYPTLRPCKHCRLLLQNHPLVTPETIIVTARLPHKIIATFSDTIHEIHTLAELLEAYRKN